MVLSDVNGNGKKSSAAERWLRQRNGQRASAVRCIFGPPEKRAHLMIIMRNEAELERKRIEFVTRYEPVGLSPNERRSFYDGLIKSSPTSQQRGGNHYQNNDRNNVKSSKADHQKYNHQQQQQQYQKQKKNSSFNHSDDERNNY